jgi:hypothetical protein
MLRWMMLSLALAPATARGAPPSDAQLQKLLEVMRVEQQLQALLPPIKAAQEQELQTLRAREGDGEQAQRARAV